MKRSLRGILAAWLAVMCALFACGCAGENKTVTVTFRAEGAEDIVLTTKYGGSVDAPEVPEKIGNEGRWDTDTLQNLTQDTVVTAVYETQGLEYTERYGAGFGRYFLVSKGRMDEDTEELYIPSEHDGGRVLEINEHGFEKLTSLKKAVCPDGLTIVGDYAFGSCKSLESVDLPDGVTKIGYSAFDLC